MCRLKLIINLFDIEPEIVKDEITGRERVVLNVENKVEDVTQSLLTMARGSTRSKEVNELTKQIISESVAEEYESIGVNSNVDSLYKNTAGLIRNTREREKKEKQKEKLTTKIEYYIIKCMNFQLNLLLIVLV